MVIWFYNVIDLYPVAFSALFIFTSAGARIMWMFDTFGIVGSPTSIFHNCGVMYVDFIFHSTPSHLFSSI